MIEIIPDFYGKGKVVVGTANQNHLRQSPTASGRSVEGNHDGRHEHLQCHAVSDIDHGPRSTADLAEEQEASYSSMHFLLSQ